MFNKHIEFQRQLDFQKERLIEALNQVVLFFKRHELYGEFDNPVVWVSHNGYDDEFITAVTEEGAEHYQDGAGTYILKLEDLSNQELIKILQAAEKTQENFLLEKHA